MAQEIAYGFVGLKDLFKRRVLEVPGGVGLVRDAIEQSARAYSQQVDALLAGMVEDTTLAKEHFLEPAGGTLQPLDEWGNPLPVQAGRGYDVAYPIRGAGTAFGTNRISRAMMTVEEANRLTIDAQNRDRDWVRRHLLAALLYNQPYDFFDQTQERAGYAGMGNLRIMPLANGDGTAYVGRGGRVITDNHYLAQADPISGAANPFETIYRELTEHPAAAGRRVIVYAADNLVADIVSLPGFVERPDPDIQPGSGRDTLSAEISPGFGDEVLGKQNGCWVVSWGELPDNYMVATVEGLPALARRQYPVQALQGFFPENHSPDGNLNESRFLRFCGFGVRNRTAALVYQVGSATYTVPDGYQQPLAA